MYFQSHEIMPQKRRALFCYPICPLLAFLCGSIRRDFQAAGDPNAVSTSTAVEDELRPCRFAGTKQHGFSFLPPLSFVLPLIFPSTPPENDWSPMFLRPKHTRFSGYCQRCITDSKEVRTWAIVAPRNQRQARGFYGNSHCVLRTRQRDCAHLNHPQIVLRNGN